MAIFNFQLPHLKKPTIKVKQGVPINDLSMPSLK